MNKANQVFSTRGLYAIVVIAAMAGTACPLAFSDSDAPADQISFAIIGDSGSGNKRQYDVARQMEVAREKTGFDFVLMLGDNIYPDGSSRYFKARFEEPYKDLLKAGVRFYPALGNHDVAHGTTAGTTYPQFEMNGQRYYTFVKGGGLAQFFALDSTKMRKEQLDWFEKELKTSKARWKIAFFHHPIYCSARRHGSDKTLRAKLEPLFIEYGVNAVFAGHDHVYERLKPQHGVYYFTEGASGQLRKHNLDRSADIYESGNDEMASFLLVNVRSSGIKVEAIGADGSMLDTAMVPKASKDIVGGSSQ
jgi:3',5'-cyclic AMP phosphodiesterase CpdA